MWRFAGRPLTEARALVEAALAAGITLFDTADIYGVSAPGGFGSAESLLGMVLAEAPAVRDRIVLATKGGIRPGVPYDSSAVYLANAIDASLTRLGVERIDLYQIHRPDLLAHPAEIARALETAHAAGKIAAVGVSNHSPAQVDALAAHLTLPIVSTQPEWSALHLDPLTDGVADQALARGLAILAWSPLAGGRLLAPSDARQSAVAVLLDARAEADGVTRSAAAYAWLMAHPARPIPIVGTQNPARIAEATGAFRVRWTRADWYAVLTAARGVKLP
jgi:predicted oxidoreductase